MNSIYGNHPLAVRDADKYGHVKVISSGQTIGFSQISDSVSDGQRVSGSGPGPAIRVTRIVAPTDLSDDSRKAVQYAVNLAQLLGAQLTLVHFYDESLRQVVLPVEHRHESILNEERTARNNLYALRDEFRKIYRKCDSALYIGNPSREIPKVAKELNADLIVISTHNPQGSSRWIFGSNAERIVGNAPCPVLIVR
jgi:nucleotide-binding universal stress UspA family protein